MVFIGIILIGLSFRHSDAAQYKVLVVMSYEEDFPWCKEIKEGIDSILGYTSNIKYFYMDTKKNFVGGDQKAKEAYALYKEFQPDGVITADDNAQSMFVIPYLRDKMKTPVMFCGVNAVPEKYGYPASNVSGILERPHFGESIAFAQQLVPSIRTFGFIIKEDPTGQAHLSQIQRESDTYSAELTQFKMPKTVKELRTMTEELKESDTLFVAAMAGVLDEAGKPLSEKDAVKIALKTYGNKPTIGAEDYIVKYGALCTVARVGEEQGSTSAQMLLKAMQGTPVSEIPITQNHKGRRVINATVMKSLGITPKPEILRGSELVKTEE
jgi:ABC-type uncharacterized transport system substrate-binding protein